MGVRVDRVSSSAKVGLRGTPIVTRGAPVSGNLAGVTSLLSHGKCEIRLEFAPACRVEVCVQNVGDHVMGGCPAGLAQPGQPARRKLREIV